MIATAFTIFPIALMLLRICIEATYRNDNSFKSMNGCKIQWNNFEMYSLFDATILALSLSSIVALSLLLSKTKGFELLSNFQVEIVADIFVDISTKCYDFQVLA